MTDSANIDSAKKTLRDCVLAGFAAGRAAGAPVADTRRAIVDAFVACGVPADKAEGMVGQP